MHEVIITMLCHNDTVAITQWKERNVKEALNGNLQCLSMVEFEMSGIDLVKVSGKTQFE